MKLTLLWCMACILAVIWSLLCDFEYRWEITALLISGGITFILYLWFKGWLNRKH